MQHGLMTFSQLRHCCYNLDPSINIQNSRSRISTWPRIQRTELRHSHLIEKPTREVGSSDRISARLSHHPSATQSSSLSSPCRPTSPRIGNKDRDSLAVKSLTKNHHSCPALEICIRGRCYQLDEKMRRRYTCAYDFLSWMGRVAKGGNKGLMYRRIEAIQTFHERGADTLRSSFVIMTHSTLTQD
ncbi:hypothetical protein IE81DRAFT_26214 [Ceraceosorus guamensis]|uniref:Uncharacterized protein n=1 Tax=Ceraceosorus guamensis TaxID=1522189 RepID=A0A316VPJ0_9BASI|nr:hypothetical protein IE81DRAFT_26214 [Ceraceosorus guamensis]PWN39442.1 hypothetical protein IE81DRAFT_26214 [Ceraceosorus guamensis]